MCPRSSMPRVTSMQAIQLDEVDAVEATPAGLSERADGCGFPGNRHSVRERSALRLGNVPAAIEIEALREALRRPRGTRRGHVARARGHDLRVPGAERRGQDDDHADPARAAPRRRRHGPRARPRPVERRARGARPDRLPAVRRRPVPATARAASSSTTSAASTAPRRCGAATSATRCGCGDADLDRPVRGYSKGMRQKLAIIQALQHDPDLAVLDEPTEGLDPLVQDGFVEILRRPPRRRAHELPLLARAVRRSRRCATARRSSATAGSSPRARSTSCAADGRAA